MVLFKESNLLVGKRFFISEQIKAIEPFIANDSAWMRANASGIVHDMVHLGDRVVKGAVLAEIGSPYGEVIDVVTASRSGVVIGKQNIPLVQEGEAMFHIANFTEGHKKVVAQIESVQDMLLPEGEGA